ncbi:MAG: hypothetical protein WA949_10910 [Phormidesmis sp.]
MFRRNQLFAIAAAGTLGLFALTGCGTKTTTAATAPATSAETSTAPSMTTSAAPAGSTAVNNSGLGEMSTLVSITKTDVEAGNLDAAKTEGKQIENAWKQVEDTIKDKDKTAYDAIETHLDGLNSTLKESKPDTAMLTTHLNELESAIGSVTQ